MLFGIAVTVFFTAFENSRVNELHCHGEVSCWVRPEIKGFFDNASELRWKGKIPNLDGY